MARIMKGKVGVIWALCPIVIQIVIMANVLWAGVAKKAPAGESVAMAAAPPADEAKVDLVIKKVQKWYDNLSDFQADFYQKSFSQTLSATTEAKGKIYFKKPNLMKWDYELPEKQIYVIDQKNFWWYVPGDGQVVKKKASTVLQDTTPLSFLAGLGNLQESFTVSLPEGSDPLSEGVSPDNSGLNNSGSNKNELDKNELDKNGANKSELNKSEPDRTGIIFLNLTPRRTQPNIEQMQLKLDAKTFDVVGINLVDPYGNTNDIDFVHLKVNQGIKNEIFHFIPPQGIDILDEESQETEEPVSPPLGSSPQI